MSMLFNRTPIIPVWLVVFGLFALFESPMTFRVSSLMTGRPGGLHLGGVEFAVLLATQAFVPDRVSRPENAVENDAFGGNSSRHLINYRRAAESAQRASRSRKFKGRLTIAARSQ